MNLPPGEMLLLTIDRVVDDVKCNHEGPMLMGAWCKCVKGMMISSPGFQMGNCPKCKGTGKRRVRVRGWMKLDYEHDFDFEDFSLDLLRSDCNRSFYYGGPLDEAQDAIIAAWRDGTLPDGVAHITEEDE